MALKFDRIITGLIVRHEANTLRKKDCRNILVCIMIIQILALFTKKVTWKKKVSPRYTTDPEQRNCLQIRYIIFRMMILAMFNYFNLLIGL